MSRQLEPCPLTGAFCSLDFCWLRWLARALLILRMDLFRQRLSTVLESGAASEGYIDFTDMLPLVNEGLSTDDMFSTREARSAVERMSGDNQVMFSDGVVYKTV